MVRCCMQYPYHIPNEWLACHSLPTCNLNDKALEELWPNIIMTDGRTDLLGLIPDFVLSTWPSFLYARCPQLGSATCYISPKVSVHLII